MITEDYVSFETAKLLKEKGFNERIISYYTESGLEGYMLGMRTTNNSQLESYFYARPTLQMAMKWLRKIHKIHISVEIGFDVDNHQYYFFVPSVCRFSDKSGEYENPFGEKEFNTYEEACEAAIKYCLENLI
jgi:hypothetical protein